MLTRGSNARMRASVLCISMLSFIGVLFVSGSALTYAAANAIDNPSFESGTPNNPTGWTKDSTGTNNATFKSDNTTPGHTGRAGEITISNFTSGDAKWLPNATTTSPGKYYIFSVWYKSSTTTQIGYFANNGFHWLKDLPATATWTEYQTDILVPSGITSIQMAAILFSTGTLDTDDYSLMESAAPVLSQGHVTLSFDDGWKTYSDNAFPILASSSLKSTEYIISQANSTDPADYMDNTTIQTIWNSGLVEIGVHTRNHVDLVKDDPVAFGYADRPTMWTNEINGALSDLKTLLPSATINTFAYPYGSYDPNVEAAVSGAGFIGARSVDDGFNLSNTDKFALRQKHITNTTTFAEVQGWIDQALADNDWVVMMFHDVRQPGDPCVDREHPDIADQDCTTTTLLQQIATYLKTKPAGTVVTVQEGLGMMTTPDITPPTITVPASPYTVMASTSTSTSAIVSFTASASDVNPAAPVVTCSPLSGTSFNLGSTTVTCTASDAANNHATSTFVVRVNAPAPVNASPIAQNLSTTTLKNVAVPVTLVATDTDSTTLTYATTSSPTHGSLSGTLPNLTYTPTTGFVGSDSFTFTATDGTSTSNAATVSISVTALPNHIPTATAQSLSLTKNTTLAITLGGSDGDSDPLTFATTSNPAHGILTGSSTALTYTPTADYVGSDSFTFTANDATSTSAGATISITVNDTPVTPPSNGGGSSSGGGGGGGGGVFGSGPLSIGFINGLVGGGFVLGTTTTAGNTTCFIFSRSLGRGMSGEDVRNLQQRLKNEGYYSGPVTGSFGPLTGAAIGKYQEKNGLPNVGKVGPQTLKKLNGICIVTTPAVTNGTSTSSTTMKKLPKIFM
jgi:peptidoglycan/xylan/chitin deacetylase (PgdA/CDA1 family)